MKLVSYHSRGLNTHILNSQIGCKEVIAAVMAVTYEEPILKLLIDKPRYLLIDNSVLVGLLEQLDDASLLANHFLAHPDFKSWVEKLYILVKRYRITVLLVSSEMQIADFLSRAPPTTAVQPVEPVKKISLNVNYALDARSSVREKATIQNVNSTSETKEKNTHRLLIMNHQLKKQSGLKGKKLHIKQAR